MISSQYHKRIFRLEDILYKIKYNNFGSPVQINEGVLCNPGCFSHTKEVAIGEAV